MRMLHVLATVNAIVLFGCASAPLDNSAGGLPSNLSRLAYTRIYCTPDADTHFESVALELTRTGAAPPAPPMYLLAGGLPATRVNFARFEPRWGATDLETGKHHPAPVVQFVAILDGVLAITTTDGEVRRFAQGEVIKVEDIAPCKGHISVNPTDKPLSIITVRQ